MSTVLEKASGALLDLLDKRGGLITTAWVLVTGGTFVGFLFWSGSVAEHRSWAILLVVLYITMPVSYWLLLAWARPTRHLLLIWLLTILGSLFYLHIAALAAAFWDGGASPHEWSLAAFWHAADTIPGLAPERILATWAKPTVQAETIFEGLVMIYVRLLTVVAVLVGLPLLWQSIRSGRAVKPQQQQGKRSSDDD